MVAACRHAARLRARPTVAGRPVVSMVRMVRSPREHKQSCLLLRQMWEGCRAGDRALTSPWRTRSPGAARCAELARELAAASMRSPPRRRTRHRRTSHRCRRGPGGTSCAQGRTPPRRRGRADQRRAHGVPGGPLHRRPGPRAPGQPRIRTAVADLLPDHTVIAEAPALPWRCWSPTTCRARSPTSSAPPSWRPPSGQRSLRG